jgi:hypothetical protein
MNIRILLFALVCLPLMSQAQIQLVPVMNIQGWAGQFLPDSCNDGPNPAYLNDTVRVRGVVINNGGLNETTGQTRWIWIRDVNAAPSTPFCGITVRSSAATSPVDINTLISGDTIEVTGIVTEFNQGTDGNGETQLNPIPNGVQLISEDAGPKPVAHLVSVGQLNGALNTNGNPSNNITSGEKLEGNFVEIQNVTVVNVALAGDRCRILVKDENNNHIWIYDRFKTQRITNGFVPPNVGDSYTSVRGLIEGWKTVCPGTGSGNRGYNINPFSLEHYVKGASSPTIGNIRKNIACPSSTSPVVVSADITDDGSVTQVELRYSTNGTNYINVPATAIGTRYSATIPAQSAGTLVRYYFLAIDNLNNTTLQPNVPGNQNPLFYTVNDLGCTIKDIQFTPFTNGRSGYTGDTLTVTGVVTASANPTNLGYIFIQQPGENAWSGIWVTGGTLISGLNLGDQVSVTGVVEEYFGLTRLANVTAANVLQVGQPIPEPVLVNPADMSTYDFAKCEKFEGMLVKLDGANLFVVDSNADAAIARNNGEYRIGTDINDPNTGCRVLAGRQNSTAFSSLNVSYVNSPLWLTQDGTMNVPLALVIPGAAVSLMQGIMTYSFGNMKLLPRNNSDVTIAVSTEDLLRKNGFLVYPNPASDRISIQLSTSGNAVEVFSAQGSRVFGQTASSDKLEISSGNWAPGLYRIQVRDQKGQVLGQTSVSVVK